VPERELAELIENLRSAIAETGTLSGEDRSRLDNLIKQVEAAAEEEAAENDNDSVLQHLDDARTRFETDHVDLMRIVNRIADILGAGGI
jgi:predicted Zn-dependent protease